MINVTGKEEREKVRQEMVRLMIVLETIFIKTLKPILNKQFIDVAVLYEAGVQEFDEGIDRHKVQLVQVFMNHYRRVYKAFGKRAFPQIEKDILKQVKPSFIKTLEDEYMDTMRNWALTQAGRKIKIINGNKKEAVRQIIKKYVGEGFTNREIAKKIKAIGKTLSLSDAKRIVQTETHTAAIKSMDAAAATTRQEMEREWVSALDERTRTSPFNHAAANGERVAMDGMFVKTGQSMKYPGWEGGSPGNIINCRCVLVYNTQ